MPRPYRIPQMHGAQNIAVWLLLPRCPPWTNLARVAESRRCRLSGRQEALMSMDKPVTPLR